MFKKFTTTLARKEFLLPKIKRYKTLCFLLVSFLITSGTALNAASLTKTLKAVYSNIVISYNGQVKSLTTEPFVVDGTTYVPLRAVSEILGANVNWANNTVYITAQTSSTVSSEQELAAKNFELASLKQQLELVQKELTDYTGSSTTLSSGNLTSSSINTTLSQIEYDYSDNYGIDWEFDLSIVSGRLELTVYYDSRYDDILSDMTASQRQSFIKNICYDIAYLHEDVEIRGTLEDSRTGKEIADYKYTTSGNFTYTEISSSTYSLSEFESELEYDYDVINLRYFSLAVNSIYLNEDYDDTLTFTVTTSLIPGSEDYRADWNNLSSSDKYLLEDLLADIIDDIEYEFSDYDYIDGIIKDSYYGTIASYRNGTLYLYSVDEE